MTNTDMPYTQKNLEWEVMMHGTGYVNYCCRLPPFCIVLYLMTLIIPLHFQGIWRSDNGFPAHGKYNYQK